MGKKIYAVDTVYGYRTDTLANWQAENPVLYHGEPVIISDGENGDWLKIGDGVTSFNDLPYMRGPQGPKGEKGEQGIQGIQGPQGKTGATGAAGKDADLSLIANALKGNKSGEIVSMTDVSPIEYNVGVKVKSKNLFKPFTNNLDKENYGVTFKCTMGGQNTILNGTSTASDGSRLYMNIQNRPILKAGVTYFITPFLVSGTASDFSLMLRNYETDDVLANSKESGVSSSYTPTQDIEVYIGMHTLVGATYENAEFVWQLEEGTTTTATAYTPYIEDLTAVSVKRYGKNLCDLRTVTFTEEGYFTLNHPIKKGVTYWVSAFVESTDTEDDYCVIRFRDSNGSHLGGHYIKKGDATFRAEVTLTADAKYIEVLSSTDSNKSAGDTATFKDILITPKGNDAQYEPFIEPTTYTPNEDGTVDGVTSLYPSMTLMTDTSGVTIDAEYNRDINKAFAELQNAIISLGGTL